MQCACNSLKLTPKQLKAIPLLAAGASGKDVASAININPATVSQWINHNKNFRSALEVFCSGCLSLAETQLEAMAVDAIAELRRLLQEAKSEQVRIKAIELIFEAIGLSAVQKKKKERGFEVFSTNAEGYDFNKLIESLTGG
jgi:hypothetical protein